MYSLRICSTSDREFPRPHPGAGLAWHHLHELLAREVSPDAAMLLAEPIFDDAKSQTHWHVTAQDDPVPLTALSEPEQKKLLARLNETRGAVEQFARSMEARGDDASRRLASALHAALLVPDEKNHVWSVDAKPVLTAWGRHRDDGLPAERRIMMRPPTKGTDAADIAKPSEEGTNAALPKGSDDETKVLPAKSGEDEAAPVKENQDTIAADETRKPGARRSRRVLWAFVLFLPLLIALIAAAYLYLSRSNYGLDITDVEGRVRRAHGSQGSLDITLAWNGREDLDLHVYCSHEQHIFYGNRKACGGELEIDRNRDEATAETDPVEHISWVAAPPAGDYRIEVVLWGRFQLAKREIPFVVVVRDHEGRKEFAGRIRETKQSVVVTTLHR